MFYLELQPLLTLILDNDVNTALPYIADFYFLQAFSEVKC